MMKLIHYSVCLTSEDGTYDSGFVPFEQFSRVSQEGRGLHGMRGTDRWKQLAYTPSPLSRVPQRCGVAMVQCQGVHSDDVSMAGACCLPLLCA